MITQATFDVIAQADVETAFGVLDYIDLIGHMPGKKLNMETADPFVSIFVGV